MTDFDFQSIRGCIFDVDGTLLDSMKVWDGLAEKYLLGIGVEPEAGLSDTIFDMTVEEGIKYVIKAHNLDLTESEVSAGIREQFEGFYKNEVELKRGARELVEALWRRGVPMALATVGDKALLDEALSRLGVRRMFGELLCCNELNTTKREPLIYELAAKSLVCAGESIEPANVLVFEDVLHAVKTAKAAGFKVVAIADDASAKDRDEIRKTADLFVRDFNEIGEYI